MSQFLLNFPIIMQVKFAYPHCCHVPRICELRFTSNHLEQRMQWGGKPLGYGDI